MAQWNAGGISGEASLISRFHATLEIVEESWRHQLYLLQAKYIVSQQQDQMHNHSRRDPDGSLTYWTPPNLTEQH